MVAKVPAMVGPPPILIDVALGHMDDEIYRRALAVGNVNDLKVEAARIVGAVQQGAILPSVGAWGLAAVLGEVADQADRAGSLRLVHSTSFMRDAAALLLRARLTLQRGGGGDG